MKVHQKPKRQNPAVGQMKIEQRIKKAMEETKQNAIEYTTIIYSIILLMVLSDKTDMTQERIMHIKTEIDRAFDSINKDYMTIPDVIKTLHDEYGYNLSEDNLLKYYPELEGYLNGEE